MSNLLNRHSYKALFFFLAMLFSSCRDLVPGDFPDFPSLPVAHCILVEGEPLELWLSWTSKIDENPLKFIKNAQVRLFVEGEHVENLAHQQNGIYTSSTTVASSVRYSCEIDIPEHDVIIAGDSLPVAVSPVNVQFINIAGRDEEGMPYQAVRFTFANNPAERRYYEAVIWESKQMYEYVFDEQLGIMLPKLTGDYYLTPMYSAGVTDPVLKSEGLPVFVFSNQFITGNEYTMTINLTSGAYSRTDDGDWNVVSNPTLLELRSVSYDYYQYVRHRYLYETGLSPEFGVQTTNISLYSNISSGFGIFAGYSAVFSDTLNVFKR